MQPQVPVRNPNNTQPRTAHPAPAGPVPVGSAPPPDGGPVTPGRAGKSRTGLISVLAVAVVLVLAAAVVGLVRPGPVKDWLASGAPETSAPAPRGSVAAPRPVLPAAGGGKKPSPAAVKAALDPLVSARALGKKVQVAVLDTASGDDLYGRAADVPTTPASTTKVLTAVTVLAARGPAYRLNTRAVAGRVPGEVVLVGGGDPTLAVGGRALVRGAARLDRLAAQVRKALGDTRPTRVVIDTSLFRGPETALGWDSDDISPGGQVSRIQALMTNGGRVEPVHHPHGGDPRSPDPAYAAGQAFAKLLGLPSGAVKRGKAPPASGAPGAPGAQLGVVQSPPLVQITDWMLQHSDNTVAEVLGRQVALAAGKPATFDGATEAILSRLRQLGLPSDEGDLYDASGLSRHDGVSPALLAQALTLAASGQQPALGGVFDGLPVAGWSGTLADRFGAPSRKNAAQGVIRAKTGTLSGVNTMAGVLMTRDGRLLAFAIMASGSTNAYAAKAALDRIPARLAACGC